MFHFQNIHIKNFKSILDEKITFWKNKTVFVGKNNSGKSNILKAIEKVTNFDRASFKQSDFLDITKSIFIEAEIEYKWDLYSIDITAKYNIKTWKIKLLHNYTNTEFEKLIKTIYIRSDRKIERKNLDNGFNKIINLILENKKFFYKNNKNKDFKSIKTLRKENSDGKTSLFITLLKLYLYSIKSIQNQGFRIFIIDQPENFLHPHATKLIDRLLQEIGQERNTQIFYSTHSPELVSNFKKDIYELSDIVFVRNINNHTYTKKIQYKYGRYEKIMINLIFKNASIFFSDAIILCEWETERISLPNIYENYNWKAGDLPKEYKNIDSTQIQSFFNLDMNNINIIDVGWKWSLPEWYSFACEIFWKDKVIAIIDKDKDFEVDSAIISQTIRKVHKQTATNIEEFKKYNWVVLPGEFEHSYKIDIIQSFLWDIIEERALRYWDNLDPEKLKESKIKLFHRIEKLKQTWKISKWYEVLFNKYFRHYGKPTIAFHLSTWLSKNNWYDRVFIDTLREIIHKLTK